MTNESRQRNLNAELSHALGFVARAGMSATNEAVHPWDDGAMNKRPRDPDFNVVPMPAKPSENRDTAMPVGATKDPRTKEAMRLVEAFLAIEDAEARAALIALAERLVSYDWLRNAQQR